MGESGLGKSMIARNYVRQSRRLAVFLSARRCGHGVIEAIASLLEGKAADVDYLRQLVYAGALDVVIDGFNEVDPATREAIRAFIIKQKSGNVLLTTQPIGKDEIPVCMTQLTVQPLASDEIEQFLAICGADRGTAESSSDYLNDCQRFLAQLRDQAADADEWEDVREILSNPMDLTIVAELIAAGQTPDLLRLQEQLFQAAAKDYFEATNVEFPLAAFSEAVYQMRLADLSEFRAAGEYAREVETLEKRKIMLCRRSGPLGGDVEETWSFRHDKITEFFICQTFQNDPERCRQHLDDPRFKGVYLLLATRLPMEAANALREDLIQHTVKSRDVTLLAPFVEYLQRRQRKAA